MSDTSDKKPVEQAAPDQSSELAETQIDIPVLKRRAVSTSKETFAATQPIPITTTLSHKQLRNMVTAAIEDALPELVESIVQKIESAQSDDNFQN